MPGKNKVQWSNARNLELRNHRVTGLALELFTKKIGIIFVTIIVRNFAHQANNTDYQSVNRQNKCIPSSKLRRKRDVNIKIK